MEKYVSTWEDTDAKQTWDLDRNNTLAFKSFHIFSILTHDDINYFKDWINKNVNEMIKCHDHTAQLQKGPASVTETKRGILSFSLITIKFGTPEGIKDII